MVHVNAFAWSNLDSSLANAIVDYDFFKLSRVGDNSLSWFRSTI